jgi:hypothetical protein
MLLQAPDPRLYLGGPDRCHRPVAKVRVDVPAEVRLDLGRGGGRWAWAARHCSPYSRTVVRPAQGSM